MGSGRGKMLTTRDPAKKRTIRRRRRGRARL